MANIFVAAGMLQIGTRAIHRKEGNPVRRQVVQRMGIGVTEDEIETVVVASGQRCLQTVVSRAVKI